MDRSHVEIFNYFICYTCLNYRRTDKIYNNYYSDSATRPAFGRPVPRFYALCPSKHSLKVGRSASSIFDLVPCLQSVGISSGLPVCCPSISFSVGLCSFSQKPLVLAISHRCGCVLVSSSDQTTLVFCFLGKFQQVLRAPPS